MIASAEKQKAKQEQPRAIEFPVKFGGVSIGEVTARISVRIDREVCNINTADEVFCGHRLTGLITLSKDDNGQTKIMDDMHHEVRATFDVKRIGITAAQVTTGLTFSLADIDVSELAPLANKAGRLIIENVAAIPVDAPVNQQDEEEEEDDTSGKYHWEGEGDAWRFFPLNMMFSGIILKSLCSAGLENMGLLADYTKSGKKLSDVEGLGPGRADKIVQEVEVFWDNNPHFKM